MKRLFYFIMVILSTIQYSKALTISVTDVTCCPGEIIVPVQVNDLNNIGAISLKLIYDPNTLVYSGYQNLNQQLLNGYLQINHQPTIGIAWYSTSPLNISSGTLLELKFTAVNGISNLTWDINNCQFADLYANILNANYINGSVYAGNCPILHGVLQYKNDAFSSLKGVTVMLLQDGTNVYQTLTDSLGNYRFEGIPAGNYVVDAWSNQAWGGVNAADALVMLQHFVGNQLLTGLNFKAADVDHTGIINASDGLMALKRYLGMITAFPAGDWVFENTSIIVEPDSVINLDFKGLCTGDVNGSHLP